ncbi:hypothetical protein GGI42DRAFT_87718 [Trichoderma sp. SZMC 28013]
MKSFLGQTEAEQEPQEAEAKSASAASPSHVEAQRRNTAQHLTQLMVRLDNKKKAIFNVVDTYQKNGQDSVQHTSSSNVCKIATDLPTRHGNVLHLKQQRLLPLRRAGFMICPRSSKPYSITWESLVAHRAIHHIFPIPLV